MKWRRSWPTAAAAPSISFGSALEPVGERRPTLWASAVFDDPNLVSCGGLAPVVELARRCGLAAVVGSHLTLPDRRGANAQLKVPALVAGMVTGAASIRDCRYLPGQLLQRRQG